MNQVRIQLQIKPKNCRFGVNITVFQGKIYKVLNNFSFKLCIKLGCLALTRQVKAWPFR